MKKSVVPAKKPQKNSNIPEKAQKKQPVEKAAAPEITVNPVFELTTPAPDMVPVVDAVKELLLASTIQPPNVEMHIDEDRTPRKFRCRITERDKRHLIKEFLLEEVIDV